MQSDRELLEQALDALDQTRAAFLKCWLEAQKRTVTLPPSEDSERLNWLQSVDGRFYNIDRITSVVGVGFNGKTSLREAIDALRAAGVER